MRLLFHNEGKVMKKWNWKIIRRVVLILLIFGIATQCYVSSRTLQTQNKFGSPWLKVKCWDKNYLLDDVKVQFSIGLYKNGETNRSNTDLSQDYDSFMGFALYFCTPDDFAEDTAPCGEIEDYKSWGNHRFIKMISSEDAASGEYDYHQPKWGNIHYAHTEELTIPKDILIEFGGTLCIKMQEIYMKGGKNFITNSCTYIVLNYSIIDGKYVNF